MGLRVRTRDMGFLHEYEFITARIDPKHVYMDLINLGYK